MTGISEAETLPTPERILLKYIWSLGKKDLLPVEKEQSLVNARRIDDAIVGEVVLASSELLLSNKFTFLYSLNSHISSP